MHIFIGGAYNGKRKYVTTVLANEDIAFYESKLPPIGDETVIIAGIEKWIATSTLSEREIIESVLQLCEKRTVYFVLTDIGRGIVPVDEHDRWLRDCVGRLYQQLFKRATTVTRIWYGIPQQLKGATY